MLEIKQCLMLQKSVVMQQWIAALARLKGSAKNAPVGLVTAAASQVDDARRALDFARTDPEKLAAQEALDRAQARFEAILIALVLNIQICRCTFWFRKCFKQSKANIAYDKR